MHYRAEIDGLRAVAVVPVILFHAGFAVARGGYVGVDVFFVISGYLITSILRDELERGAFSVVRFYERRARRILPALFLVMAACLPFAWAWMLPADRKGFAQSLVAVSTFGSNLLFWRTSDYFDIATELKPLLHTWSLSVEEQYYVLFPLLLALAWGLGKRWIGAGLAALSIASLALAQYTSTRYPQAAFFLLPARAWELFIGALLALFPARLQALQGQRRLAGALGLLGLGAISISVLVFDAGTPFPSLYALVPTLGAALVIACATPATAVGRLLCQPAVVGVGLISYSAYLWHQPLFAFARHRSLDEPGAAIMAGLAVLSLALAWLTWRFVERPFRIRQRFSRRQVFAFGAMGSALFVSLGLVGHFGDGFRSSWLRDHPQSRVAMQLLADAQRESPVFVPARRIDDHGCVFSMENLTPAAEARIEACAAGNGRGIAVLGDSHATGLFDSLASNNGGRAPFLVGVTKNGCNLPTQRPGCHYEEFARFVDRHPGVFSVVVVEKAGWQMLASTDHEEVTPVDLQKISLTGAFAGMRPDEDAIRRVVAYLEPLSRRVPVVWFGPRVEPQFAERAVMRLGCAHDYGLRTGQAATYAAIDAAIQRQVASSPGIRFVSQIRSYHLQFPRDFMNCEKLYWMDGNHYSPIGEKEFGGRFDFVAFLRANYGVGPG
jgi:peptidoglycan/LPS O-acetylase OafA/YrhL